MNHGAIVENKRLGHILQDARVLQEQRDSRRGRSAPARTNQGLKPVQLKVTPGKKVSRQLNTDDLAMAIQKAHSSL